MIKSWSEQNKFLKYKAVARERYTTYKIKTLLPEQKTVVITGADTGFQKS